MLEEYEAKLHLFEKFQKRNALLDQLSELITENVNSKERPKVLDLIKEIKELD